MHPYLNGCEPRMNNNFDIHAEGVDTSISSSTDRTAFDKMQAAVLNITKDIEQFSKFVSEVNEISDDDDTEPPTKRSKQVMS